MTPKEKLAVDIIELVARHSPYSPGTQEHQQYVLGRVAGELSRLLYTDTRLLSEFIRRNRQ